jgi:NitT/TauT family transport system permease protein
VSLGRDATLSFTPDASHLDMAPARLRYYAARSLLRMFCALGASYIFAIFTSQAWNLAFGFYHSLSTQPRDLDDAVTLLGLTRWRRFWRLDVPSGAIGLIWNGMMSMGGGWFFLIASEAISVNRQTYTLPGVGSYAGAAIANGNLTQVLYAIVTMGIIVIGVNMVFWRPLVAWGEKFRNEQSEPDESPRSRVLDALRSSSWSRAFGRLRELVAEPINALGDRLFGQHRAAVDVLDQPSSVRDIVFWMTSGLVPSYGLWRFTAYVISVEGWHVFVVPFTDGLLTLARVLAVIAVATAMFVPIGVKIGCSPRASRAAQPIVQVFASFPANFLFPFAVWAFVRYRISLDYGGILLMSLGAQWYVLFNVIAGARSIPSDLIEAMDDLDVRGWQRWKRFFLPAVFPSYVTGAITASGGAWNASIVAEVVT